MPEDYEDWSSAEMARAIKERISMWDLLDHMEIDYPRRGSEGVKISIRDEAIPSCHIYEDGFYDYGTGEGGSVIDFYMLMTGKTKLHRTCKELLVGDIGTGDVVHRSVKEMVDLTDRFMTESDLLTFHKKDVDWFLEHKWAPISFETAGLAHIRATKHGILIPTWHEGKVVGVKVRGWSGVKSSMKGSTFTTGLWSPFTKPSKIKNLVICEGESDTLALWQHLLPLRSHGVAVVSLPSGANRWRPEWLDSWLLPKEATRVAFMQDNDEAGKKIAEKIAASYKWVKVYETNEDVRSDLLRPKQSEWIAPLMRRITRKLG
jgi:hypothetical protein